MVDFNFNINSLFPQEVNIVGTDLIPVGYQGDASHAAARHQVCTVLDMMGQASAKAQGLKTAITSGSKMMTVENQKAYILVDKSGNSGKGSVVGLLKVGKKKLFLLDESGKPNEMIPQCVLDFYVAETRQRSGCGKMLFESMLMGEQVEPRYLAIDRPSPKLVSFLRKHYNLARTIPQVNNYVIFCGFFQDQPALAASQTPRRARLYMGKLQYV